MKKPFLFLLFLALMLPAVSPGWGLFVHRTLTQLSVYALPSNMQPFYFRHLKTLSRLATQAEARRNADPKEAMKHVIYMDQYGDDPFGAMPKAWDKAEAKFTADTLRKYGTLPWTIMEVKDQLTEAFKQRDTAAILRHSADLCHLAANAHGPLHTTLNYDGQLTDQAGLQTLWEAKLPERYIAEYKLDAEPAKYLKDPLADVWMAIQKSYGFLGATFDMEEKVTKKFTPETKFVFSHKYGKTRRAYSDAFAEAYHKQVGGMIAFQLKLAPTFVASLWLTAWKDAGSPNLTELLTKKPSKEEKEKLGTDVKAFKDNQLVDQQLLMALQKEEVITQRDEIDSAVDMAPPVLETAEPAPAAAPTAPAAPTEAPAKGAGRGKNAKATKEEKKAEKLAGGPAEEGSEKTKVKDGATKQKEKKKKGDKKDGDGWGAPAGSGW